MSWQKFLEYQSHEALKCELVWATVLGHVQWQAGTEFEIYTQEIYWE